MKKATKKSGRTVLVRTYSAGVHFGTLVSLNGREVVLADSRRIWSWQGANTLNEIAMSGCAVGSKVSGPVSNITLTEAIEIIDMSDGAIRVMAQIGWVK